MLLYLRAQTNVSKSTENLKEYMIALPYCSFTLGKTAFKIKIRGNFRGVSCINV